MNTLFSYFVTISRITFLDLHFVWKVLHLVFLSLFMQPLSLPSSHVSGAPGSVSDKFLPRVGLFLSPLTRSVSFVLGIGDKE